MLFLLIFFRLCWIISRCLITTKKNLSRLVFTTPFVGDLFLSYFVSLRHFLEFIGENKLTVLYRNYNLVSNLFCYSPSLIPSVPTPPFHPLASLVFSSDSQSFIKIKITLVTDVSQKKKKTSLKCCQQGHGWIHKNLAFSKNGVTRHLSYVVIFKTRSCVQFCRSWYALQVSNPDLTVWL